MESRIGATEAARTFSDLLNRVRYRGEQFVVVRGGEPVCRISPVGPARCTGADLLARLSAPGRLDKEYLASVEKLSRKQPRLPKLRWER